MYIHEFAFIMQIVYYHLYMYIMYLYQWKHKILGL